jgi:hypothetical protein
MALRTVILWVHVMCGVVWIGASAGVAIAAAVLGSEPEEWAKFATRSIPRINRVCVAVASLIPLTGIANLTFVVQARHGVLPEEFNAILGAKVAIYAGMGLALWAAWRTGTSESIGSADPQTDKPNTRRLTDLYATIVVLGAVALGLGLWLSGT